MQQCRRLLSRGKRTSAQRKRKALGNTFPGRLAFVDEFLQLREQALVGKSSNLLVDLGVGHTPYAALDSARALPLRVVAVEHNPRFVDAARTWLDGNAATDEIDLREGSFDLPLQNHEVAHVVRVMNLFRSGYRDDEIAPALSQIAAGVAADGLVVDGSSSDDGSVAAVLLLRRDATSSSSSPPALVREALLFCMQTNARGFHPRQFRTLLPRDLRFNLTPDSSVLRLFNEWGRCRDAVAADDEACSPRQAFERTARHLAESASEPGVALGDDDLWSRGLMLWRPPAGVPHGGLHEKRPPAERKRSAGTGGTASTSKGASGGALGGALGASRFGYQDETLAEECAVQ